MVGGVDSALHASANSFFHMPVCCGVLVQVLYDWVDSLEGFDSLSYSLVCAFPKRVFGEDSKAQSVEAAGLVPQGALFVQVHDDDDHAVAGGQA
jgi:hypothetical protein